MHWKQNTMRGLIATTILIGIVLVFSLSSCSGNGNTQTAPGNEMPAPTATALLGELVATRTPEPTSTPGPLANEVSNLSAQAGLATTRFLGLSVADWINLGLSLLFILIGYALGTLVIRRLLPRWARRTPSRFDNEILHAVGSDIRWLIVVLTTSFATDRLTFISVGLKSVLKDLYFIIGLYLVIRLVWKLIDLGGEWFQKSSVREGRGDELAPIILLVKRVSNALIGIIGITMLLSHFGVNVMALSAALGIGGLAISLAARDTIADAIAGVILLIDRPFRVGDRIEIQGAGTWGDVTNIGLRTTSIRTRDNSMIVVPNSVISHNQVINYSYPDPRYRIQTYVDIDYGTDIETVRRLLVDTVSQVEGVLLDKPVDALYDDMSGSAMKFRVRWWIGSYTDTRHMIDRVHTAIQHALDKAGIPSPNTASNVNLLVGQATTERISRAFGSHSADSGKSNKNTPSDDTGWEK
jgi:MscS family membrane protein